MKKLAYSSICILFVLLASVVRQAVLKKAIPAAAALSVNSSLQAVSEESPEMAGYPV